MLTEKQETDLRKSFNEILKNGKGIIFLVYPGKYTYFHMEDVTNPEHVYNAIGEFLKESFNLDLDDVVEVLKFVHKQCHIKIERDQKLKPE